MDEVTGKDENSITNESGCCFSNCEWSEWREEEDVRTHAVVQTTFSVSDEGWTWANVEETESIGRVLGWSWIVIVVDCAPLNDWIIQ